MTGRADATGGQPRTASPFRLGPDIVADPLRHTITRGGRTIAVEPGVMRLLSHFAARPGEVISKEELREQVWGTHVVDEAVHRAISLLRSALGDSPRNSAIIETIPRHGYRLLVRPAAVARESKRPNRRRLALAAAAAAVVAVAFLASPGLRVGAGDATDQPAVVPQAETPAAARAAPPQVEPQSGPRAVAVAPKAPTRKSRTPARAPEPAERGPMREPGVAPPAPAPRAVAPSQGSAQDAPAEAPLPASS